jgi:hypothetical protein
MPAKKKTKKVNSSPLSFEFCGKTYQIKLSIGQYGNGGVAIGMVDVSNKEPEQFAYATVWLDYLMGEYDGKAIAFLDTNNLPGIDKFCEANKLGRFTGFKKESGFCQYPRFELNMKEIRKHEFAE